MSPRTQTSTTSTSAHRAARMRAATAGSLLANTRRRASPSLEAQARQASATGSMQTVWRTRKKQGVASSSFPTTYPPRWSSWSGRRTTAVFCTASVILWCHVVGIALTVPCSSNTALSSCTTTMSRSYASSSSTTAALPRGCGPRSTSTSSTSVGETLSWRGALGHPAATTVPSTVTTRVACGAAPTARTTSSRWVRRGSSLRLRPKARRCGVSYLPSRGGPPPQWGSSPRGHSAPLASLASSLPHATRPAIAHSSRSCARGHVSSPVSQHVEHSLPCSCARLSRTTCFAHASVSETLDGVSTRCSSRCLSRPGFDARNVGELSFFSGKGLL
mmetsp:Transcript_21209/g.56597  ORF Transcript_21209/g.56597 Transcript_21209/m.56597 type:complete len:332 (+) Transcript_21209:628-1623(+)